MCNSWDVSDYIIRNIMVQGLLQQVEGRHLNKNYEQAFIPPNPSIKFPVPEKKQSSAVYGSDISRCVQRNDFPTSEVPFIWQSSRLPLLDMGQHAAHQ